MCSCASTSIPVGIMFWNLIAKQMVEFQTDPKLIRLLKGSLLDLIIRDKKKGKNWFKKMENLPICTYKNVFYS